MNTGIIIQARLSSTRLPEKVLLELPYLGGISVLAQVIRRLKKVKGCDKIIVATTTEKEDERIIEEAKREEVKYFRGSKNDVLERYYFAAKENALDQIIRVTSDCPCIDPFIVEATIETHLKEHADYTSNTLKNKYPHGYDVEIFSFHTLEKIHVSAKDPYEREHVTPYIYLSHPELFNIHNIEAQEIYRTMDARITLDSQKDYLFLCSIYDYLYAKNPFFTFHDVWNLLNNKPWLKEINRDVFQKKKFNNVKNELKEAVKILEFQEMYNAAAILKKNYRHENINS